VATLTLSKGSRYTIPGVLNEASLRAIMQDALAGNAGSTLPGGDRKNTVIWDDFGDQVLVHLDSVAVRLIKRLIFVSADFECEQTGRAPLIVTLAFGSLRDGAGLVAATDEVPRGHPLLAGRWGRIFQETVWAALLATARRHAGERGQVALSIHVLDGHLRLAAAPSLALGSAALKSLAPAVPGTPERTPR
jgi:hypothetical protein